MHGLLLCAHNDTSRDGHAESIQQFGEAAGQLEELLADIRTRGKLPTAEQLKLVGQLSPPTPLSHKQTCTVRGGCFACMLQDIQQLEVELAQKVRC